MNVYFKWILVVFLNSIVGFILGYKGSGIVHLSGMVLGVVTWCSIYISFDLYLRKLGRIEASRRLFLSAMFRIPFQFVIFPDMFAGLLAISTLKYIGAGVLGEQFFPAYMATLITGLYLGFFCGIIYLLIYVGERVRYWQKNA